MKLLDGKAAIITGASAGIGRAAAGLFAEHGASLVLVARRADRLEEVAAKIEQDGGQVRVVVGDVTQENTHRDAVAMAVDTFGRLDVAFNNAGLVGEMGPLADTCMETWTQVIDANLTAAFLGARSQIPAMLAGGGGALVFTSSFAGLMGLVRAVTADYAAQGIRANALLPGGTATEMAGDADQREWAASLHAMKRIADPREIAQAALFLASDMASFVTGSALWADGGNAAVKL